MGVERSGRLAPCTRAKGFFGLSLEDLGPSLYAKAAVRTLSDARIVWMNDRWFAEQGIDLNSSETRHSVRNDILARFAVEITAHDLLSDGDQPIFGADRYGGSTGAASGGSGRCAAREGFNVKGVGRTPLAPKQVDWDHSHGWMWLPEALREAICSEIAQAELPWGGVPCVAIIDTGRVVTDAADPRPQLFRRRALVVRPNFVRPAHFERSIYFGSAGTVSSDQFLDAERTRQAFTAATEAAGGRAQLFSSLDEMMLRFGSQIGAARANKLWSGRFMSPNVSIDGSLADFGIFRAVPNWHRLTGIQSERLGQDGPHLAAAIKSLYYYARKYVGVDHGVRSEDALFGAVEAEIEASFIRTLLDGLGARELAHAGLRDELSPLLQEFYSHQQRYVMRANSAEAEASPCLYDYLTRTDLHTPRPLALARAIREKIGAHNSAQPAWRLSTANFSRWLAPRPALYYVALGESVERAAREVATAGASAEQVATAYIDRMVGSSRRTWRLLPAGFEIRGVGYQQGAAVVYVSGSDDGRPGAWIECPCSDGIGFPLGHSVCLEELENTVITDNGQAMIYVPIETDLRVKTVEIGGTRLDLPPPVH